jgi:hypothetical protein
MQRKSLCLTAERVAGPSRQVDLPSSMVAPWASPRRARGDGDPQAIVTVIADLLSHLGAGGSTSEPP